MPSSQRGTAGSPPVFRLMFPAVTEVSDLLLPPAFEPVAVRTDPFAAALESVERDAGTGNFFWADLPSHFDVAVVWTPELPLARMWPARFAPMVAMAEALGALGPPNVRVTFSWPDGIAVNGAAVGGIRTAAPRDATPHAVPDWMVVGLVLRLNYANEETAPGQAPEQTALTEEGFDVLSKDLAESFARNLLYWFHQWTERGPDSVAGHWLTYLNAAGPSSCSLDLATGDLLCSGPDAVSVRRPLPPAGDPPGWSLDR